MSLFKKEKKKETKVDLPLPIRPTPIVKEVIKSEIDSDFSLVGNEDESFDKIVDMVRKKETETNIKTRELMEKSLIQNKEELEEIKKNKKDVENMHDSLKKTYEVLKTREQLVSINIQNAEKFFQ